MWGSFPVLDGPLIHCPRWNSCSFGPISVYFFDLRHFRNSYFGYCYFDGYLCHLYLLPPDGFQCGTPRGVCYEEFFILIQLGISASVLEMVFFLCCSGILPHHSSWGYLPQSLAAALLFVSLNRSQPSCTWLWFPYELGVQLHLTGFRSPLTHRVIETPISLSLLSITFSTTHDTSCGWGLFLCSLFCSTGLLDYLSFSPKVLLYYAVIYPGEENGTPTQYSCLDNPMDWGVLWAAVHGVAKSQTWLSN